LDATLRAMPLLTRFCWRFVFNALIFLTSLSVLNSPNACGTF
jgi:hypothetical protein